MRTVLSTKKSLFDPFEVEIDGAVYTSRAFNKPLFAELTKLETKAKAKATTDADKVAAVYDQVGLIFGIPKELAYELDIRDVKEILDKIKASIDNPVKAVPTEAEKNGSGPGEAASH